MNLTNPSLSPKTSFKMYLRGPTLPGQRLPCALPLGPPITCTCDNNFPVSYFLGHEILKVQELCPVFLGVFRADH